MSTRYSNNERDNIFKRMQPPALLRRRFAKAQWVELVMYRYP